MHGITIFKLQIFDLSVSKQTNTNNTSLRNCHGLGCNVFKKKNKTQLIMSASRKINSKRKTFWQMLVHDEIGIVKCILQKKSRF